MASSEPALSFPPLFRGEATRGGPFSKAIARAKAGTDPGLIVHRLTPQRLEAGLVLAPDVPLEAAMAAVLVAANGFADAFGALAPSEIACQFDWPGGIRINGGRAGCLRVAASGAEGSEVPAWLVIGIDVAMRGRAGGEPGETPDTTTLWDEGCGAMAPARLLESWSRHTLVWLHDWQEGGMGKLHQHWRARAFAIGREVAFKIGGRSYAGRFLGLDEAGGMLLKAGDETRLLPLTAMLEHGQ